jgi:hypothetical protein
MHVLSFAATRVAYHFDKSRPADSLDDETELINSLLWIHAHMNDKETLTRLIEASARLERKIGTYYRLLSQKYRDDASFWWRLYMEEQNHSSIYHSFLEKYLPMTMFPGEIIDHNLDTIEHTISRISDVIADFDTRSHDKKTDYALALDIETSSSEHLFQQAMKHENPDTNLQIIQHIVDEDILHQEQIQERFDALE